jgi:hypothetical protein
LQILSRLRNINLLSDDVISLLIFKEFVHFDDVGVVLKQIYNTKDMEK